MKKLIILSEEEKGFVRAIRSIKDLVNSITRKSNVLPYEILICYLLYEDELYHSDKEPMKAKDIAQRIGVSKSALTRIMDGLVVKGYIKRIIPESNRRVNYYSLTDDAKRQCECEYKDFLLKLKLLEERVGMENFTNFVSTVNTAVDIFKEDM